MTQIYVNCALVKPKGIHIYNSSAQLWEAEKVGYVRVHGEWVPFIKYYFDIYNNGIQVIGFSQYALANPGSKFEVRTDCLYLKGYNNNGY